MTQKTTAGDPAEAVARLESQLAGAVARLNGVEADLGRRLAAVERRLADGGAEAPRRPARADVLGAVVRHFLATGNAPATATEVAAAVGLPKASVATLLSASRTVPFAASKAAGELTRWWLADPEAARERVVVGPRKGRPPVLTNAGRVAAALREKGPMTARQLQAATGLSNGSLSAILYGPEAARRFEKRRMNGDEFLPFVWSLKPEAGDGGDCGGADAGAGVPDAAGAGAGGDGDADRGGPP